MPWHFELFQSASQRTNIGWKYLPTEKYKIPWILSISVKTASWAILPDHSCSIFSLYLVFLRILCKLFMLFSSILSFLDLKPDLKVFYDSHCLNFEEIFETIISKIIFLSYPDAWMPIHHFPQTNCISYTICILSNSKFCICKWICFSWTCHTSSRKRGKQEKRRNSSNAGNQQNHMLAYYNECQNVHG